MSVILCILDGWGISNTALSDFDAIHQGNTNFYDSLTRKFPMSMLSASGQDIGLPIGQMGNSEVGHMTIGAGRIINHDIIRISTELENLKSNQNLLNFTNKMKKTNGIVHILGLLSDGGVHSHCSHIYRIIDHLKSENIKYNMHAFTDGRDTPPRSALKYIKRDPNIKTISGRYYAMDRDSRWERTKLAYNAITIAKTDNKFTTSEECIEYFYQKDITDEFIAPSVIGEYTGINDGDALLIMNFRADRIRQIAAELIGTSHRCQKKIRFSDILFMSEYFENSCVKTILPRTNIQNSLGEIIANNKLNQLRVAETEKYAHVTYFFNGNQEEKYPGEERILIDSPKVATYNLQPEMSAYKITDALIPQILSKKFELIVVNYANADMVGHTGDLNAAIAAVESIDKCLQKVAQAADTAKSTLIITADHGNAECMYDLKNKMPHTSHTLNKVPFVIVDKKLQNIQLKNGTLADIMPTILNMLNLQIPAQVSGDNLA